MSNGNAGVTDPVRISAWTSARFSGDVFAVSRACLAAWMV